MGKRKKGGSHCCQVVVRVSSWNPGSESLERIMSLGEPKIRLHSTICRSSGSRDMILKNLLMSERAVLSFMTAKESAWKTTREKRCPMKYSRRPGWRQDR